MKVYELMSFLASLPANTSVFIDAPEYENIVIAVSADIDDDGDVVICCDSD